MGGGTNRVVPALLGKTVIGKTDIVSFIIVIIAIFTSNWVSGAGFPI